MSEKVRVNDQDIEEFEQEMANFEDKLPSKIDANPEQVETGLAKLVLTLIELIRRLLERQALRRMENNTLSDDEIERIGNTFIQLEVKMEELKKVFGLKAEDLNIDLGPLGNLM